jgi:hypothetical protein
MRDAKENYTTIKVRREDAEELKERLPFLRTDALRIAYLLGHNVLEEVRHKPKENK